MSDAITAGVGIAIALISLAAIAVVLSKKANTPSVLSSLGTSFSGVISAAVSPITSGSSSGGIASNGGMG